MQASLDFRDDTAPVPLMSSVRSIEDLIEDAIGSLKSVLERGQPLVVAFSGGKDSSVCLNLALQAALKLLRESKHVPTIVIANSDTRMESPEIHQHVHREIPKAKKFAKEAGIKLKVVISSPAVADEFWVRVVAGQKLPSFPGMKHDCTSDLKITPAQRARRKILKHLGEAEGTACTVVGTRYDESVIRAANMKIRGESADRPWLNEDGELVISPIAYWTTDDVWEYLSLARGKAIDSYSDFDETFRIYADAGGTSCAIVSDMVTSGIKSARPCGARTGCWSCTPIGDTDKSLQAMLDSDPRYEYMRGLNDLRNFLFTTRWDLSRRSWMPRSLHGGYAAVQVDTYSPAMQRELLQYLLTLQISEKEAASRLGIRPRFTIITEESLIAIDALWSLNGMQRPFTALKIWRDIYRDGQRYEVPKLDTFPAVPLPPTRYIYVGEDWDEGKARLTSGLRDVTAEEFGGAGCIGHTELKDGRVVLDLETDETFSVDTEGVCMLMEFEMDRLIDEYWANPSYEPTTAYFYYASYGVIAIANGQISQIDNRMRRTQFKLRSGIHPGITTDELLAKCVDTETVPFDVRQAFEKSKVARARLIQPVLFH